MKKLSLTNKKIIELIKEKPRTLKELMRLTGKTEYSIKSRIYYLRHKKGFIEIDTQLHENKKPRTYAWMIGNYNTKQIIAVLNHRFKKTNTQIKFTSKSNTKALQITKNSQEVINTITQNTKNESENLMLPEPKE